MTNPEIPEKRGRGRPRKEPVPEITCDLQFIIPAAHPDDGDYTKHFLSLGFKKALGSYGAIKFDYAERDDGYTTITGKGSFTCPVTEFDDICIDLTLVSVSWRRATLIVDGKALLDGTQTVNGIPFIVLENLERYLKLNGRNQPGK